MTPQKHQDKFWQRVDNSNPDGCWEWIGTKTPAGYGIVTINKKTSYGHRLSWMIHNGDIPEGLEVCHTCDNRSCVNPAHLWIGTHWENMYDAIEKGNLPKRTDLDDILKMRADGLSYAKIGRRLGISRARVHQITKDNPRNCLEKPRTDF